MKDHYELELTTSSAKARDLYDQGVAKYLAAELGVVETFEAALDADEGLALAHIGIARQSAMMGDRDRVRAALAAAETLSKDLSEREQGHIHFNALLLRGKGAEALEFARDQHLVDFPRDAMVAQAGTGIFGIIGFSGRAARDVEVFAFTKALEPFAKQDWWFQAQHGFAQLELGWFDEAQKWLDLALKNNARSAHSAHIMAHLYYERGETSLGLDFLKGWQAAQGAGGTMRCHLAWHQALWSLENGAITRVWELFDSAVAPGQADIPPLNNMSDAAALLFRADLAGFEAPQEKWQAVSDFSEAWFPKPGVVFTGFHASLAHAMAGNTERLGRILDGVKGPNAERLRAVAKAFQAMAAKDWAEAAQHFATGAMDHVRLGGSNAQRDLIDLAYAACLARQGAVDEARRLLELRRPMIHGEKVVFGLAS